PCIRCQVDQGSGVRLHFRYECCNGSTHALSLSSSALSLHHHETESVAFVLAFASCNASPGRSGISWMSVWMTSKLIFALRLKVEINAARSPVPTSASLLSIREGKRASRESKFCPATATKTVPRSVEVFARLKSTWSPARPVNMDIFSITAMTFDVGGLRSRTADLLPTAAACPATQPNLLQPSRYLFSAPLKSLWTMYRSPASCLIGGDPFAPKYFWMPRAKRPTRISL